MNIGKFSVKNPVLINILMVAIVALGYLSFDRLPRELETEVSFSWVFIIVPYPGVSAEEVEKTIVVKIEDEISDVDNIKKIISVSKEGQGFLQVQFDDDISDEEFTRLYQELRVEIDKVSLPEGAIDPIIDDFSTADFLPLVNVVLKGGDDPVALNAAAKNLQEKILDLKHVSKANILGGQDREIWVEADRKKLEAYGVSLNEVTDALKYRNINIPGGLLKTDSANYILRTEGELQSPIDYKKIIVRKKVGKGSIAIGDVATINSGLAEGQYDSRFNGEKSVSLLVSKSSGGNSIKIVEQVEKLAEEFKPFLPKGVTIELANNTTWQIKDTLSTLGKNSVMGFFLLIIVLFFFIGFRNSFITALGIPIAFAITFSFMEYIGESLNSSSLFALVLVLGMIVDHAIVIIENCYRYYQQGYSAHQAAIKGANEVVWPVIAATGTTVAAFLPLMLLPGIMGKYMRVIPIVVSLALVASTVEALFFLPSHFAEWSSKKKRKESGIFQKMQSVFSKLVTALYRHRYITFALTIAIIVSTMMLLPMVKKNLFEGSAMSQMLIDIELPIGTPRSRTNEVVSRFEKKLLPLIGNGEVLSISTYVGFLQGEVDWLTQSNVGQISIALQEMKKGRKRTVLEIIESTKKLCKNIPGAEVVKYRRIENGPPVDKPVSFRLRGDNYDEMEAIAGSMKKMLSEYKELYNISDNYEKGIPKLVIKINEHRAAEYGLSVASIGMYIRNGFDGVVATIYRDEDEEIDVVVKFNEQGRGSIEDISMMKFPSPMGQFVPFSNVAKIVREDGIGTIKREQKSREIKVTADATDQTRIPEISARIERDFKSKYSKLYPGVSINMAGAFAEFNNVLIELVRLLGIGIFLMYIILGTQFKSYAQPLIMLLTIPFAFSGCVLFLVLSGTSLSIVVLYAVVALAGIAVNDAIVLISFINAQRRAGMNAKEAVVSGAAMRLRPIILTSVTTMGGLVPMAIGAGGTTGMWGPMASTIIFGLLFSTVGTLIVIPCVYGILNDITSLFGFKMKLEGE